MGAKDWKAALDHFMDTMRVYVDLLDDPEAHTNFAMQVTFLPTLQRYVAGDRSDDLYADMMGVTE